MDRRVSGICPLGRYPDLMKRKLITGSLKLVTALGIFLGALMIVSSVGVFLDKSATADRDSEMAFVMVGLGIVFLLIATGTWMLRQRYLPEAERSALVTSATREAVTWALLILIPLHVAELLHVLDYGAARSLLGGLAAFAIGVAIAHRYRGGPEEGDLVTIQWSGGYRPALVNLVFGDGRSREFELAILDPISMQRPHEFDLARLAADLAAGRFNDEVLLVNQLREHDVKVAIKRSKVTRELELARFAEVRV